MRTALAEWEDQQLHCEPVRSQKGIKSLSENPLWAAPGTLLCLSILLAALPGAAQSLFTEVSATAFRQPLPNAVGMAWGDYDNDNWPDLLLMEENPGSRMALLHNEGNGRFADQLELVQAQVPHEVNGGSLFGDYDNDGDLDLYLFLLFDDTRRSYRIPNVLARNDSGRFSGATQEAGLADSLPTANALWLDYDRDGYLDLYTGNLGLVSSTVPPDSTVRNRLYRNQGDGRFAAATRVAGLELQLHPQGGGSGGGMAAADFDGDGWPDLYLGVGGASNRLFLNNTQGGFRDATSGDLADPSQATGVAVGDIDNDGDLDLFQAVGARFTEAPFRSVMLLNLGGGQFLDVTEGVGLGSLNGQNVLGAGMADIDNDGDLDLLISQPHFLFLNNGDGTFADQSSRSGVARTGGALAFGDYDRDGSLDFVVGPFKPSAQVCCLRNFLYRNQGSANHYLEVELAGGKSNRQGIGARLIATAGELRQMREILGGLGVQQDEMVAHFGLGERRRVERLEVRWPSGEVEVLEDIPADQRIRVFEGRQEYQAVQPAAWVVALPDTAVSGQRTDLKAVVRPPLFAPDARISRVVAELSGLGVAAVVPLQDQGDGTYLLELGGVQIEGTKEYPPSLGFTSAPSGAKLGNAEILIEQESSLGRRWTRLSREVVVLPAMTAVLEERTASLPRTFSLAQNFPNPFNNETVIRFELPQGAEAELAVFDLAGQRVARLVEGEREAGAYTLRWDGRDERGQDLASGVYLYRLRAGTWLETRKLVLVR